jgi:hypothetical protein
MAPRDVSLRRMNLVAIGGIADLVRRPCCRWNDANDPTVWSGRAVQEVSSTWLMRSCITVSGLSLERLLRAIMGISAHAT